MTLYDLYTKLKDIITLVGVLIQSACSIHFFISFLEEEQIDLSPFMKRM